MTSIIQNLVGAFKSATPKPVTGEKLKVSSLVGRAAFVYEKIRNAVDYNEEHLIRKLAISRIMKRKLLFEKVVLENYLLEKHHVDNIAEQLLQELMRAKYFQGEVPRSLVTEVDTVIQKYILLINTVKEVEGKINKKMVRFLFEMASVEIETVLTPDIKEKALSRAMFSVMNSRIILPKGLDTEKEKELQLYLACHRSLFKWDESMIDYLLLTLYYPEWKNADRELILRIANNIQKIRAEFEKQKKHPWQKRMMNILQKKSIIFWVIQDILDENLDKAGAIFSDKEILESEVKKACQKRYKGVGVKLRRGVVRSIIYVFFTKMLLAIALEFPMDIFIAGAINYTSAAINILFPPVLMLLVAIMIRLPKKENTAKILEEVNLISLGEGDSKIYPLKDPRKRGKVFKYAFNIIFFVTFIGSIMVIFWALNKLDFNFFSSLIFILFLTLVSFFGIRIRRPVNDILAVDRKESFFGAIFAFIAMPWVSLGRFMSVQFGKFNVLAFVLDFIIEAPFKLLVEIFEDLFSFYREKKEDMLQDQS
jgi:hypothetical protein